MHLHGRSDGGKFRETGRSDRLFKVEADETFIGGKEKNKHAWQRTGGKQGGADKVPVLALLERGGELRTRTTLNLSKRTVQDVIREHMKPRTNMMTDEHGAFSGF